MYNEWENQIYNREDTIKYLVIELSHLKKYVHIKLHVSTSSSFIIAKNWKQLMLLARIMDKRISAPWYNGIRLSKDKEWFSDLCSNMEASHKQFAKWKKPDWKATYCLTAFIWNSMEAAYGGRKISASQEPGLLRGMRKLLGLKKLFYNLIVAVVT